MTEANEYTDLIILANAWHKMNGQRVRRLSCPCSCCHGRTVDEDAFAVFQALSEKKREAQCDSSLHS